MKRSWNYWKLCRISHMQGIPRWHFCWFLVCWRNIGRISSFSAQYSAKHSQFLLWCTFAFLGMDVQIWTWNISHSQPPSFSLYWILMPLWLKLRLMLQSVLHFVEGLKHWLLFSRGRQKHLTSVLMRQANVDSCFRGPFFIYMSFCKPSWWILG